MFDGEHPLAEADTRSLVAALLRAGWSQAKIAQVLGISKSTVCYHARRLDRPSNPRCARRYDWSEVQRYYDKAHSVRECQERFGFAKGAWADAVRRGTTAPHARGPLLS